MLFLAVFCGFLAENQREHIVEEHRAKEYAKSLLNDLKEDTFELQNGINHIDFLISAIDSIVSIVSNNHDKTSLPGKFYYYSRFVSNLYTLDWNNSTINQLVQSGNLRYFKNKELVHKINVYYAAQQVNNRNNQISHETRMRAADLRDKILQTNYYSPFVNLDFMKEQNVHVPSPEIDSLMLLELPLTKNATQYMDQYINLLSDWKWRLEFYSKSYPTLIQQVKEIMQILKDEYHLE